MAEVSGMVQFPVEDSDDSSGGALIGALLKEKAWDFIATLRNEIQHPGISSSMHVVLCTLLSLLIVCT